MDSGNDGPGYQLAESRVGKDQPSPFCGKIKVGGDDSLGELEKCLSTWV